MAATALLLIAHGSRQPEANADLFHLCDCLRQHGYGVVEAAFLEFVEPTISQAGARCVEQKAERVVLVPYFLSAGVHVRRDLSEAQRELSDRFPSVEFRLAEPVGRHPLMVEVVLDRVKEVT